MKPVRQLVRVQHGSHLYGTQTPSSDQDFKGVHLPSGRSIVLQQPENVIERDIVSKIGGKNTNEAVDEQSFSLQKFFDMLMKGDTVATEILFAPPLDADPMWPVIRQTGRALLNRQCKGFVGYCVRQAAKYGIKGSRMAAVHKVTTELARQSLGRINTARLAVIEDELRGFTDGMEHVRWENIPHPDGRECWHINVCDRKMPMTATIKEAFNVYSKVWENYGERARAAMTNEGIDWKAMSHAVRVARQAIELLQTGNITFPRPDADELRDIKMGWRTYDDVSRLLEAEVARVQVISETSLLPAESDRAVADASVVSFYVGQVVAEVATE